MDNVRNRGLSVGTLRENYKYLNSNIEKVEVYWGWWRQEEFEDTKGVIRSR